MERSSTLQNYLDLYPILLQRLMLTLPNPIIIFFYFSGLGDLHNKVPMGYGKVSNQAVSEEYFRNNCKGEISLLKTNMKLASSLD